MGEPRTLNPVDQFLGWPAKLAAAKQGDRKAVYAEYLASTVWQTKRIGALERAGSRCQVCNRTKDLNVHHRTYERVGDEAPEDLTVLCRKCHERFHGIDNGPVGNSDHKPCRICQTNLTTKGLCRPCRELQRGIKKRKKRRSGGPHPSRHAVQSVACPTCHAGEGEPCRARKANHIARVYRYQEKQKGRERHALKA